ncbi:hypothetical protein ACLB2K_074302 [Fragaria x ananassa]
MYPLYRHPETSKGSPKIPSDLQPFINLVSIPFLPLVPDFLPEGAEASFNVPEQQEQQYANLQVAVDLLQTPIKQFIADKMPDWIIADFFTLWVVDIAKENGVLPTIQSLTSPPEWITFPSLLALKDYEAVKRLLSWEVNKTGMSLNRRLAKIVSASQVLAIRTCSEIEGDYLEVYKKITGKPVIPTGVLPPDQPGKRAEGEVNSDASMFDWLDNQKPRTSEKGLVCFGWVPQMEILGHPSIRGSLFHSGWGSVIETLQFGHCLVVLHFMYYQPLNARLLVEKGLAAEVKRNKDGPFSREEIAKSLRLAMVEEEGEQLRGNVKQRQAWLVDHPCTDIVPT